MAGQEEVARLLLEAGAVCNEFTFDGDRCHYAALTPAIRALLRQFEQRPPPLAPLAAALRPLAPADGGAGAASAQLGCAARLQLARGRRTAQALRQGAHRTRWKPRVSQGKPSGMRPGSWERDSVRRTCMCRAVVVAWHLCVRHTHMPHPLAERRPGRPEFIMAACVCSQNICPAGSPAYYQGARRVSGRATEVACPADFAFVVAGERVELHRAVAAARAPLLRRQLLGPWAPQVQGALGCRRAGQKCPARAPCPTWARMLLGLSEQSKRDGRSLWAVRQRAIHTVAHMRILWEWDC